MQVNLPRHLKWSQSTDKTDILKASKHAGGATLPFSIGCRTDAMVVATNAALAEEGALLWCVMRMQKACGCVQEQGGRLWSALVIFVRMARSCACKQTRTVRMQSNCCDCRL
jgi:hypothetical protein